MSSLRRRLLRALMFPALIALLGGLFAYRTASDVISSAYDANLLNLADGVAHRIRLDTDRLVLDMADGGKALLRNDSVDTIFFRVRGDDGALIAGDGDLPSADDVAVGSAPEYYNVRYLDSAIRGVRLHRMVAGRGFYVTVAETLGKRQSALQQLLLGFGFAMLAVGVAAAAIARFAIPSGLAPLARLSARLAQRSGEDLSPVELGSVPLELRPLVQALNALLARLAAAREQQGSFLQNAAHQLRTPLANLQMQVELLGSHPEPGQLAHVTQAVSRVTRLANQLLALARAEAGERLRMDARSVDLAPLIDDMLDDWLVVADRKHIDLGVHRASARVVGDGTLLRELIANLVDNALKYAPAGGRVNLHCAQHADAVFLTVEDDGPGIALAERERVFRRFYRTPGSAGSGVGLGLAIVGEIVAVHRGTVVLDTPPSGRGLSVCVRLPGVKASAAACPAG